MPSEKSSQLTARGHTSARAIEDPKHTHTQQGVHKTEKVHRRQETPPKSECQRLLLIFGCKTMVVTPPCLTHHPSSIRSARYSSVEYSSEYLCPQYARCCGVVFFLVVQNWRLKHDLCYSSRPLRQNLFAPINVNNMHMYVCSIFPPFFPKRTHPSNVQPTHCLQRQSIMAEEGAARLLGGLELHEEAPGE